MILNIITLLAVGYSIYTSIQNKKQIQNLAAPSNGSKGEQGIQGFQGAKGFQGATGKTGPKGAKGAKGTQGPEGKLDADGLYLLIEEHVRDYHRDGKEFPREDFEKPLK